MPAANLRYEFTFSRHFFVGAGIGYQGRNNLIAKHIQDNHKYTFGTFSAPVFRFMAGWYRNFYEAQGIRVKLELSMRPVDFTDHIYQEKYISGTKEDLYDLHLSEKSNYYTAMLVVSNMLNLKYKVFFERSWGIGVTWRSGQYTRDFSGSSGPACDRGEKGTFVRNDFRFTIHYGKSFGKKFGPGARG